MRRCIRLKEQYKFIKSLVIGIVGDLTRSKNECLQYEWHQAVTRSQLHGSLEISFLDQLVFGILELPLFSRWKKLGDKQNLRKIYKLWHIQYIGNGTLKRYNDIRMDLDKKNHVSQTHFTPSLGVDEVLVKGKNRWKIIQWFYKIYGYIYYILICTTKVLILHKQIVLWRIWEIKRWRIFIFMFS